MSMALGSKVLDVDDAGFDFPRTLAMARYILDLGFAGCVHGKKCLRHQSQRCDCNRLCPSEKDMFTYHFPMVTEP